MGGSLFSREKWLTFRPRLTTGQGATDRFARAAISRDRQGNIAHAFELLLDGALKLLRQPPKTLRRDVVSGCMDDVPRSLRRILWRFLRDGDKGLPLATLPAKSKWQPILKDRITGLLHDMETVCGLQPADNWKNKLTVARLPDGPLVPDPGAGTGPVGLRISTVHQAKGESVAVVLYVAKPSDVTSLLGGPGTEEGRIGYVAVTRAKDLLLLGVPATTKAAVLKELETVGFKPWV